MESSNFGADAARSKRLDAGFLLGNKFEVTGFLGEGGTGIVYEAIRIADADAPIATRVALKVIHAHLAGDRQIRGRFTREAAILRRLHGMHLCPVLDFGELADPMRQGANLLYMVLPKIDGQSLEALHKAESELPHDRVINLAAQICDALTEAHSQGVIHRDLKPANVIVCKNDHIVVVDFGMAKIVTGGGTGTTGLTQHNMVFGTPEYMAPEQARGDELDARCDVYAVGVILYELLCGKVPFSGSTPLNVLTAHLTLEPPAPKKAAPARNISDALDAITLFAIAKDPSERYPTAAALASALRRAASNPNSIDSVRPPPPSSHKFSLEDAHAETMPAPEPSHDPARRISTVRPQTPLRQSSVPPITVRPLRSPSRGWIALWIVAAVIGIALGVYLSLRTP